MTDPTATAAADEHPDRRFFAAVYDLTMRPMERAVLPPHRKYLAADLSGDVLDLGTGTGAMYPYFAEHADDATIHAVEPDRHMRRRAVDAAEAVGLDVDVRAAPAEDLPFDADSMDAVVASIVFCTIPDVDAALGEVARVLRPGGEFRFLEHVRAGGTRGRIQDLADPVWQRVAGGCHPNRETAEVIADHPAFDLVDVERLDEGVGLTKPFVRGTAVRRDEE